MHEIHSVTQLHLLCIILALYPRNGQIVKQFVCGALQHIWCISPKDLLPAGQFGTVAIDVILYYLVLFSKWSPVKIVSIARDGQVQVLKNIIVKRHAQRSWKSSSQTNQIFWISDLYIKGLKPNCVVISLVTCLVKRLTIMFQLHTTAP